MDPSIRDPTGLTDEELYKLFEYRAVAESKLRDLQYDQAMNRGAREADLKRAYEESLADLASFEEELSSQGKAVPGRNHVQTGAITMLPGSTDTGFVLVPDEDLAPAGPPPPMGGPNVPPHPGGPTPRASGKNRRTAPMMATRASASSSYINKRRIAVFAIGVIMLVAGAAFITGRINPPTAPTSEAPATTGGGPSSSSNGGHGAFTLLPTGQKTQNPSIEALPSRAPLASVAPTSSFQDVFGGLNPGDQIDRDQWNPNAGQDQCFVHDKDRSLANGTDVSTSGSYISTWFIQDSTRVESIIPHGNYGFTPGALTVYATEYGIYCTYEQVLEMVTAEMLADQSVSDRVLVAWNDPNLAGMYTLITFDGIDYFGGAVDPATDTSCHAQNAMGGLIQNNGQLNKSNYYFRIQPWMGGPEYESWLPPLADDGSYYQRADGVKGSFWKFKADLCNDAQILGDAVGSYGRRTGGHANVGRAQMLNGDFTNVVAEYDNDLWILPDGSTAKDDSGKPRTNPIKGWYKLVKP